MEKIVDGFVITKTEDEAGYSVVKIGKKVNPRRNFLTMTLADDNIVVFGMLNNGLPGGGRVRVSIEVLQAAIEMLSASKEPDCESCPYKTTMGALPATPDRPYCLLAHCFIDELGGVCLKILPIEEIRRLCSNYRPPEKMDDNKSCCMAHLAEARAFCCSIHKIEDLLRCEDYDLEVPKESPLQVSQE